MKLRYIDSIRGLAILMVILVHVSQKVVGLNAISYLLSAYGQMGVQLFFVASAYTLCLSSANRDDESHPIKKFAIRRFFRIAPAYYVGIVLYFIMALVPDNKISMQEDYSIVNVLANVFFIHGFYPPANNTIVPGGWSIGTEMAFYALFPMLFFFARKIASVSLKAIPIVIFLILVSSQVLLFLIYKFTGHHIANNSFLYNSLIVQIPVFCIGIGYFVLENKVKIKLDWKLDLFAFIFFSSLSLKLWTMQPDHLFSIIPFVSACSFIFLINVFKKNERLNHSILEKIGKASYSMYLLHFMFISIVSVFIAGRLSGSVDPTMLLIVLFTITVFGTLLLALIFEKYVEKPFIEMGKSIIRKMDRSEATSLASLSSSKNIDRS